MAKRFSSTEIWKEDWFLDMPNDYKLFWFYILSACDHSGIFKVNVKYFCSINNVDVEVDIALEFFNKGKKRIRKINGSLWLIEDFFIFQYGHSLNTNNTVHKSIKDIYEKNGVELGSIRGLKEVESESGRGKGRG